MTYQEFKKKQLESDRAIQKLDDEELSICKKIRRMGGVERLSKEDRVRLHEITGMIKRLMADLAQAHKLTNIRRALRK